MSMAASHYLGSDHGGKPALPRSFTNDEGIPFHVIRRPYSLSAEPSAGLPTFRVAHIRGHGWGNIVKLPRRKFLHLAAAAAALAAVSRAAAAQGYPSRPVRLIVG